MSVRLFICLSVSLFMSACRSVYLSANLFISLPVNLFICLPFGSSVGLSVGVSVCLIAFGCCIFALFRWLTVGWFVGWFNKLSVFSHNYSVDSCRVTILN